MKKKIPAKLFHSKLLLFGEHIINRGAMGLAIPLDKFDGMLRIGDVKEKHIRESNHSLELLANYIIYQEDLASVYDTNLLLEDVELGLYFDSNIPQGYGLGSSGALVAAIFNRYRKFKKRNYAVNDVKHELSRLESYYHGKSSGLDAIVSFLNKAVIVTNGEVSEVFELQKSEHTSMKFFLINTHMERKTSDFVNLFLKRCEEKKFAGDLQMSLIPSSNIAIKSFLSKRYSDLWKSMKIISQIQLDMLPDFIPKKFHEIWQTGLRNDAFAFKICGAGGGGFIIGFTKADTDLSAMLSPFDVLEVMSF